jgi:predicted Fe-Mo cluster-binding NifX family protein
LVKIVIPTDGNKGLDEKVAMHFGRCLTYTFLDENGKLLEVIKNTSSHMGGHGLPPELMKQHGADVLLCRGLGGRALQMCRDIGIEVYVCEAETVKDIFELWKSSALKQAGSEDTCKH